MKIDKDLWGIGWVTDRRPTRKEIARKGYSTWITDSVCTDRSWYPSIDKAWRNDATIAAVKEELHVSWEKLVEHCRERYSSVELKVVDPESITITWLHDDGSMSWFRIYKLDGCIDGYAGFLAPSTLLLVGKYIEGLKDED